jgi:WD40 repeat protein
VKCVRKLVLDGAAAHTVAYSRVGALLIAGLCRATEEQTTSSIGVWNAHSGKLQCRLGDLDNVIMSLDISHDNLKVGAAAGNQVRTLWDLRSKTIERQWAERDGSDLVFHPRSTLWAFSTCGETRTSTLAYVRVQDYSTGEQLHCLDHEQTIVRCICFSADGSMIVTSTEAGNVYEWSTQTGERRRTLRGHRCPVY